MPNPIQNLSPKSKRQLEIKNMFFPQIQQQRQKQIKRHIVSNTNLHKQNSGLLLQKKPSPKIYQKPRQIRKPLQLTKKPKRKVPTKHDPTSKRIYYNQIDKYKKMAQKDNSHLAKIFGGKNGGGSGVVHHRKKNKGYNLKPVLGNKRRGPKRSRN